MNKAHFTWPRGPVYLLIFAILLFFVPKHLEGPRIISADTDHGLTILNTLALVPPIVSVYWIQRGLWSRRIYLFNRITIYPGAGSLLIFGMGLGLGMLIASAFAEFNYWWAVGGILFLTVLVLIVLKSGKNYPEED